MKSAFGETVAKFAHLRQRSAAPLRGRIVAIVAQLVRASACVAEGSGFEPRRSPHFPCNDRQIAIMNTPWGYPDFDAHEALDRGLIRSIHPAQDLLDAARELAREIAENTSAVSVAMTRAMLWRLSATEHPMMAHRIDSRSIYRLSRSDDAREGVPMMLDAWVAGDVADAGVHGPGGSVTLTGSHG